MERVRDRRGLSPELRRVLDAHDIDSENFKPARFRTPDVPDVSDLPVRVADTDEGDSSDGIEVKSGTATSDEEMGWYEVQFDEPFTGGRRPVVNATATQRTGEFDSGAFEPPEQEVDALELIGIDGLDIESLEISGLSIPDHSVPDRELSHDADVPAVSTDVGSPSIDFDGLEGVEVPTGTDFSQIDIEDINIEAPELEHFSADERFSFESEFKQFSRDIGEGYYNLAEEAFDRYIPTPGGTDLPGRMSDAWDFIMSETYGHGRDTKSGEGVVESIYGQLGALLDDTISEAFGNKALEQENLADGVDEAIIDHNDRIVTTFLDFESELRDELDTFVSDTINETEDLRLDSDNAVKDLSANVEEAVDELIVNIEDEILNVVDDIVSDLEDFGIDVEDAVLDVDDALIVVEDEIEILTEDVNDELEILTEDINTAFEDYNSDVESQVDGLREDIQEGVNDALSDLEEQVNDRFEELNSNQEDLNEQINTAYAEITGMSEEALNKSMELLYSSIGMPKGELLVPVQIRNVSNEGFEFLGYEGGTEIDWTATSNTSGTVGTGEGSPDVDEIVDEVIDRLEERGAIN